MNFVTRFLRGRLAVRYVIPLAIAAFAALPMRHAEAAILAVTNCNDGGFGSLRDAARIAASGDTIDMSGLGCSRIGLTRGQIALPQNDLVLLGPGRFALTIDGGNIGRIFAHTGTGTLRVYRLSVANGRFANVDATGGCIYSAGNVELIRSRVHNCQTIPCCALEPGDAGGGVYARGRLLLSQSSVYYSRTNGGPGGGIAGGDVTIYRSQIYNNEGNDGGGAFAFRTMAVTYSLIHNNRGGRGGGLQVGGGDEERLVVNKSTISSNWSSGSGGGIDTSGAEEIWIINSTISGNSGYYAGAAWLMPHTFILNSTIAFNESRRSDECSPALSMSRDSLLVSSIVARNTCLGGPSVDIDASDDFGFGALSGGHNLIGVAEGPMPADTIFGDPRLGPLTNNGGPTRTHLPAADSPAINRGQNLLDQQYDQRGPGFMRVKGGIADIGAVER